MKKELLVIIICILGLLKAGDEILREANYYTQLKDNYVRCDLCPNNCVLKEGETGICKVRRNIGGKLYSLVYGKPCSINIDPIEKKPLYHVLPGSRILSIATVGCNLNCNFCQNWTISQSSPEEIDVQYSEPAEIIELAKTYGCESIAFTYTEPTVFYEYMYDIAVLAKSEGLKTVWVTCGYINEEPLRKLAPYIDAANIDLKGFNEEFYRTYTTGSLQPVLNALKIAKEEGIFVEITNLMIPEANTDEKDVRLMCRWIKTNMGAECPLHFSRFFPKYKLINRPQTPVNVLERSLQIAREEGLKYVYVGNISGISENTYCSECGELLIERSGYLIEKNVIKEGKCPVCGKPIPGIYK